MLPYRAVRVLSGTMHYFEKFSCSQSVKLKQNDNPKADVSLELKFEWCNRAWHVFFCFQAPWHFALVANSKAVATLVAMHIL